MTNDIERLEEALAYLHAAEQERDRLRAEVRAMCDLLSVQPETIAGQTLVEAVQTILHERDTARAEVVRVRRMALAFYDEARVATTFPALWRACDAFAAAWAGAKGEEE